MQTMRVVINNSYMFKIYNAQRKQMAVPFIEKITNKATIIIKEDYPIIYEQHHPEKLAERLELLINDEIIESFEHTESVINYLVICVKYGIDSQYLMQNKSLASILHNSELHENEKLYLIDEKLYHL